MPDLHHQFGEIDIYLFDQLLRGRISPGMRILDAGCGNGRNLVYLLRQGFDVFGVDRDLLAVDDALRLAATLAPRLPKANFQVAEIEKLPHHDAFFDVVITSAVLHFAEDDRHFQAMLDGAWRVLKPSGILFCRLASSIGMEKKVKRIKGRRFLLPDGSERYLVDEALLLKLAAKLHADLIDPIKPPSSRIKDA